MVKVALQISATLENVDELKTEHPNYSFFLKFKCTNCGEESGDKWHDLSESDTVNSDSRTPQGFNFYMKCRLCGRENTVDIIKGSNAPYNLEDSGKFKSIVSFDCRGCEPCEFSPRAGWIVKSAEGGQQFDEIDLSDDDWVEYDTKNKTSVGIYEFRSQFIKIKK